MPFAEEMYKDGFVIVKVLAELGDLSMEELAQRHSTIGAYLEADV